MQLNADVPLAAKFISRWSNLISHCRLARLKFLELSNVPAIRLVKVRWFSFCEVGTQLDKYWSAVMGVIDEQNDFAVEGRQALRQMVSVENIFMLRLELALISDVGRPLINFCYTREGDGFQAPTTRTI
jgi:hypothetical protein